MRVLIVTSRLPFPLSCGVAVRDYQLARHLARRHEVTMLGHAGPEATDGIETLRQEIGDIRVVPLDEAGALSRRLSQAKTLASPQPFVMSEASSAAMRRELDALLADKSFDLVQLESVRMTGLRFPPGVGLVIDEHNIEYELLRRMSRGERSLPRRAFSAIEHLKLRRVEIAAWRAADACLVTSEREEAIVRSEAPDTKVLTVPNGVDTDYFFPSTDVPEPDSLVFTGLLSYRPNVDAVHHLVEEIFPLIAQQRPGSTLTIVGDGDKVVRHLERPGVRFTGFVEDVRPYLRRAAVVVVPLRVGGGTRLKVVEAFALGKAVVSTTLGAEGIMARDGEHLLVGDTAEAFANQVVRLLGDPVQAHRLGEAAATLARTHYSWNDAATRIDELYQSVVLERGVGAV